MTLLQLENVTNQASYFALKARDLAVEYAPKLLGAIIVYLIGSWIIKKFAALLGRVFEKKKYDHSLGTFLSSLIRVVLTILLLLSVFEMIGMKITAFAALLAGAGLAIGAALNGSLGNFAGGVMMLLFKPFKVGDMIEAQGQTGIVKEHGIFNTVILTPDNKTAILPNGPLSTGTIINYTTHGNLRVDLTMAIALDMDIAKARSVAIEAMKQHPKVLETPAPDVNVLKVGDGMVTLTVQPYTTQPDYWDVYFGVQELVKNAWDAHGIAGPIPHRVLIQKS